MNAPPGSSQPDRSASGETPDAGDRVRIRYRVRFAKTGLLRWTSHRDLARLWERLLRRARLQLSMTEGFHPKPRVGFPSALALGISGLDEVVELELAEELSAGELFDRLSRDEQPGLQIISVQRMPEGVGKAKLLRGDYVISLPDPDLGAAEIDRDSIRSQIDALLERDAVTIERKKKPLTVSVAEQILSLRLEDQIDMSLAASDSATLKPTDVLELIGCADWLEHGSQITRTSVVLAREVDSTAPEFFANAASRPNHP